MRLPVLGLDLRSIYQILGHPQGWPLFFRSFDVFQEQRIREIAAFCDRTRRWIAEQHESRHKSARSGVSHLEEREKIENRLRIGRNLRSGMEAGRMRMAKQWSHD